MIDMRRTVSLLLALAMLLAAPNALASATVHRMGDESVNKIAITIDDCYDMGILTDMLDLCDELKVRVTFYPVGCNIKPEDGDVWRRLVDAGHEIGNHSNSHRNMINMAARDVYKQLTGMENALNDALGYEYYVATFRPPFGKQGKAPYRRLLEKYGYNDVILWSISQTDPVKAMESVKNGSIFLYHTKAKDYRCLVELIPQLLEAGYELVTVSELLGVEKVERDRD